MLRHSTSIICIASRDRLSAATVRTWSKYATVIRIISHVTSEKHTPHNIHIQKSLGFPYPLANVSVDNVYIKQQLGIIDSDTISFNGSLLMSFNRENTIDVAQCSFYSSSQPLPAPEWSALFPLRRL